MGKEYSTSFEKVYSDLAIKNKIELIPFMLEGVAGHPKMNLPDGIHPNPEGQKLICELIWHHTIDFKKSNTRCSE